MKKLISAIFLLSLFCIEHSLAANTHSLPNLDRTCKTCTRIHNDSVNVFNRRAIRLNQSGFKPNHYKYAYVADPTETTFKVIDANSGKEVRREPKLSTALISQRFQQRVNTSSLWVKIPRQHSISAPIFTTPFLKNR